MAKLSALVIPAVIDTSGVDKGISQIKNKLSRVRGQSVGGQGGSGFSSGVTPHGGYLPSVGSPIGSAMASAFGAAAGSRNTPYGNFTSQRNVTSLQNLKQQIAFRNNNPVSRLFQRHANNLFAQAATWQTQGNSYAALGPGLGGLNPMAYSLNQQGKVWGNRAERIGRGYSRASQGFNRFMAPVGGMGQGLPKWLLPAALGTAAYEFFDPKNQKSRFANTAEFAGNENYQAMVQLRRQAFQPQNQFMSLFQSIDVGAQKARGKHGGPTTLRSMGQTLGGAVQGFGEVLGTASEGPIAMAGKLMGGSNDLATQAYTEGMEAVVGGMILSVENAFKRLFS